MVPHSQEVLDTLAMEHSVLDRDYERRVETDNLLGAPIDESQLRNAYPGSARSTSISNIRDVDQHERLPSVGSLNPFISHGGGVSPKFTTPGNSVIKGKSSTINVKSPMGNNNQQQINNELDNPLFTLANSVPTNSDHGEVRNDPHDNQQISTNEWLNHSGGSNSGSQLLAMQVLAQSIAQDGTEQVLDSVEGESLNSTSAVTNVTVEENDVNPDRNTNQSNDIGGLDIGNEEDNLKKISTTADGKLFICDHPGCNKTFSRKMNLMSHYQSTHEHKKPFVCGKCNKAFSRHSDRRRHEKSQHNETSTFVCGGLLDSGAHWGCGKIFKRKDGLTAHWKSGKAKKKCFTGLNDESHRRIESDLAKS